jgi:3-methyl-2-oxobutanoate hydroxymethyltransferase
MSEDKASAPYGQPRPAESTPSRKRMTVPKVRARKGGERLVMVTAYDATFARMLDEGGADLLLVGDSLGMVVQGNDDTLSVTVDDIIYHCRAVARGTRYAHIVGDMPFLSYNVTPEEAVRNAGRILAEGRAHSVKLEGGRPVVPVIERLVGAGIPVMAHVGLTPQSVHAMGGFRVQGRDDASAQRILDDAHAVAEAGAYALVLEGIPADLAERITAAIDIPTIGIGAGAQCDGQVLVCYDMLGLTPDLRPKFVRRFDELFDRGKQAMEQYSAAVRSGEFPAPEHTFGPAGSKKGPRAVGA